MGDRTVLVIFAHPDDETLGCGGTIARHAAEGDKVHWLVLAARQSSRFEEPELADPEYTNVRKADASHAAEILGISSHTLLDYHDNRLDTVPLLDIVKAVERTKARVSPDIVYTHHWGDVNVDHRTVCDAVLAAFRPMPGERCSDILAFEILSSTGWGRPSAPHAFEPNYFVEVSDTLAQKVSALEAYRSEMREFPHARSIEAIRALATYRGSQVGVQAAEAFVVIRLLRRGGMSG